MMHGATTKIASNDIYSFFLILCYDCIIKVTTKYEQDRFIPKVSMWRLSRSILLILDAE